MLLASARSGAAARSTVQPIAAACCCGDRDDLPAVTPLSRRSGMSRLVMLSDATGVRAYAGVIPARMLAQMHQSGYGACKDAAERANTAETRHPAALWRITTASRLVPKDCEQRRPRREAGRPLSGHRPGAPAVGTGRSPGWDACWTARAGGSPDPRGYRREGCPAERKEGGRGARKICVPTLSVTGQAAFSDRARRRLARKKGVTLGSGDPANAGGVGVQLSSLRSAPVRLARQRVPAGHGGNRAK
jgi:hypothetical protein